MRLATQRAPAFLLALACAFVLVLGPRVVRAGPPPETTAAENADTSTGGVDAAEARAEAEEAAEVVATLESTDRLAEIRGEVSELGAEMSSVAIGALEAEVRVLLEDLETAEASVASLDPDTTPLSTLQRLRDRWNELAEEHQAVAARLEESRTAAREHAARVETLAERVASVGDSGEPADTDAARDPLLDEIANLRRDAARTARRIRYIDAEMNSVGASIEKTRQLIERTVVDVRARAFVRTQAPLWSAEAWQATEDPHSLADTWRERAQAIGRYGYNAPERLVLHGLLLLIVGFLLRMLRRRVAHEEHTATDQPWLVAVFFVLLVGRPVHPEAPAEVWDLLRLLSVVPMSVLVLHSIPRPMHAPLLGLVGLVVLDVLRTWSWTGGIGSRLGVIGICVVGTLLTLAYMRAARERADERRRDESLHVWHRAAVWGGLTSSALLATSGVAAVLGWVNLANLACTSTLRSGFAALTILFGYQLLRSALGALIESDWAKHSRAVENHGEQIRERLDKVLRRVAVFAWFIAALDAFSVRQSVFEWIRARMDATVDIGLLHINPGSAVALVIGAWLSVLVTRALVFILREEALPRFPLRRGVPQAIVTVARVGLAALAMFVVLALAGIEFSELAIMFGALGVGIGLGLQDIVNNFVAGLVLLFERPINTGDLVEIEDGTLGRVTNIGLRASRIRTLSGAEVIVPNAALTDERVTNWTLSDDRYRVEIMVGVAYGTDAETVRSLLRGVLDDHPRVLSHPEPVVLFHGFGDSALEFELRAWTDREKLGDWELTRSELNVAIQKALAEAHIEVPFPQRDLHIRSSAVALGAPPVDREPESEGTTSDGRVASGGSTDDRSV